MKKTGLFFGSFNPIHVGHLIIANYMATQTDIEEVWFVVSPQNPFKEKKSLAKDYDRLHLVRLAIENNPNFRASDIEFDLPKPSYTIDTLAVLSEKFPKREFVLIMGGDNLQTIHKWKNADVLMKNYGIYVYKRPEYDLSAVPEYANVEIFEAPMMSISASYIRKCIRTDKSIEYLVTPPVFKYIQNSNLYQ